MKTAAFTVATVTFLSSVVAAQYDAWIPYVNSGSDIEHGQAIVAWNGQFIVADANHSTTAACNYWDTNCVGKNTTILSGLTLGAGSGTLWMGITQTGGQKTYMHEPPVGSFMRGYTKLWSYTAASDGDDAGIPKHKVTGDRFIVTNTTTGYGRAGSGGLRLASVSVDSEGKESLSNVFGLCSSGNGYQRVTVGGGKGCFPVEIEVKQNKVDAPLYYKCDGCEFRNDRDDAAACKYPFCEFTPAWLS